MLNKYNKYINIPGARDANASRAPVAHGIPHLTHDWWPGSASHAHRLGLAQAQAWLRPWPVGNLSGDFHIPKKKKSSHQF